MQKKVLIACFITLIGVMAGVFVGLFSFANDEVAQSIQYDPPKKQTTPEKLVVQSWADKMAKTSSRDFFLPVNELFIQLDLRDAEAPKERFFQLLIDRTDRYSQFCIVQTLSSYALPYVFVKDKEEQSIYVNTKTKEALVNVVEKLKEYDIESTIKEVWL